ncbi:MAG TPA: hypothetical protein VF666_01620 [Pyrinomonadaceae bacterium]|jgi:hypothetical protein
MKKASVMASLLLVVLLFAHADDAHAQQTTPSEPPSSAAPAASPNRPPQEERETMPAANPADVSSIDNILRALYESVSGAAGERRDEKRFRSLFVPGARLIPTAPRPDGGATARVFDVDEFYQRVNKNTEKMGFYEKEIARQTQIYGNIAHIFSTYEARRAANDPAPFVRGINSIQLLKDGQRWWVVTVYWDAERPGNTIPDEYLPKTSNRKRATPKEK